jgi:hypothetical protein
MFSEMIADLKQGKMPDSGGMAKRLDFALTKKLGIVKLPPAFWMNDPKINPRTDHLFWAALLLKDRSRIDLVLSVLAVEVAEKVDSAKGTDKETLERRIPGLVNELLRLMPDYEQRVAFERSLQKIIPEWMGENPEVSDG